MLSSMSNQPMPLPKPLGPAFSTRDYSVQTTILPGTDLALVATAPSEHSPLVGLSLYVQKEEIKREASQCGLLRMFGSALDSMGLVGPVSREPISIDWEKEARGAIGNLTYRGPGSGSSVHHFETEINSRFLHVPYIFDDHFYVDSLGRSPEHRPPLASKAQCQIDMSQISPIFPNLFYVSAQSNFPGTDDPLIEAHFPFVVIPNHHPSGPGEVYSVGSALDFLNGLFIQGVDLSRRSFTVERKYKF
jgi:hypothetical protein